MTEACGSRVGECHMILKHRAASEQELLEALSIQSEIDIRGNQAKIFDALGHLVMCYDYNLREDHIHQMSMESGERWAITDLMGMHFVS